MCQCVVCDCLWCNIGGTCAGLSSLYCCFGVWCCQPDELRNLKPSCCLCLECTGLGANVLCLGCVFFAQDWLKSYSAAVTQGK